MIEQLEDVAAAIVAALTGITARREDRGGPPQVADFSLFLDGDKQGLLEVSISTSSARHTQNDAITRQLPRRIADSKRYWHMVLQHESVKVKPLAEALPRLLLEIEKSVPEGHFAQMHDPVTLKFFPNGLPSEISCELYELGVLFLYSLPSGRTTNEGWLNVQQPSIGGSIGPSLVTDEVNKVLSQPDNQKKLAQSTGPRAELFVWLVDTIGAMAMTIPNYEGKIDTGGDVNAPRLPKAVSRVWVGSYPTIDRRPARAIWVSDGGAWEICEVPLLDPGAHRFLPAIRD